MFQVTYCTPNMHVFQASPPKDGDICICGAKMWAWHGKNVKDGYLYTKPVTPIERRKLFKLIPGGKPDKETK